MIKIKNGQTIICGTMLDIMVDVTCIIGTLRRKKDFPEELLKEAIDNGFRLGEILKNGGTLEDFFKELEEDIND